MNTLADVGGQWVPPGGDQTGSEVIKILEEQSKHGLIMSGIVAWIQINYNRGATDIWKKIAEQSWKNEEVTAAREAIKAAAGEKLEILVPGMTKTRTEKGKDSKKKKELDDIIESVIKLQENLVMPLVIASSDQILRNPAARGSIDKSTTDTPEGLVSRMMNMEEVMVKFIDNTAAQMACLSTEVKKVTEVKSSLSGASSIQRAEKIHETEVSGEDSNSYANVTVSGIHPSGRLGSSSQPPTSFHPGERPAQFNSTSVLANLLKKNTERENPKQRGRNVFHGSSRSEETFLAADVTLVASGLGLGVEEKDLEDFLETKDIKTVTIECITKKELLDQNKVRSKTMKVVVKAKDHEKAMNPDIWPFRVGVRYFRAESRKPGGPGGLRQSSRGEAVRGVSSSTSQEAEAGGISNRDQRSIPGSSQWSNQRNQRRNQNQSTDISMNNLYKVLISPETQELLKALGASSGGP